ncbi:MAG: malate:quinone oxidoreductase [Opitutales bacterium]|nr:malate:quinone oxidoreductase [Opitutales bacterium]
MLEVVQQCFGDVLKTPEGHSRMKEMIPTYDEDLTQADQAEHQAAVSEDAEGSLGLI